MSVAERDQHEWKQDETMTIEKTQQLHWRRQQQQPFVSRKTPSENLCVVEMKHI